jgi:hypothetical protein
METNNNLFRFKRTKKTSSSFKTNSILNDYHRRKSSPNIPINPLLRNSVTKTNKHVKSSTNSSKNILKKIFQSDKKENKLIDLDVKRKKSIVFTEHLLKHKIEEDISHQIIKNSKDNIKKENFTNISKNSEKDNYLDKFKKRKKSKNENKTDNNKKDYKRNFYKKKLIYDSLEDSEEVNNNDEDNFFISPENTFILIFDFIIVLFLIIYIIYIPLKMSYHKQNYIYIKKYDKIYFYLIDTLFIIDLLIGFFRAYYNQELKLITNSRKIVKKFFARYFIYDLISAFPFLTLIVREYKDFIQYNINDNKDFFY